MEKLDLIFIAVKKTLSNIKYFIGFVILSITFFMMFISIQVFLNSSNSFLFQLSLFKLNDYLILFFLSVLTSLLITMQIFSYNQIKKYEAGKTILSGFSAVFASMIGTVSCSSCIMSVVGFLGIGTIFFLLEYKWIIVSISILLALISIYFTSLKVNGICISCKKKDNTFQSRLLYK